MTEAMFEGELREGFLPNTLQYVAMNKLTGCLVLRKGNGIVGKVFFNQGKLVHAVADTQLGTAGLARLLTWQTGRFGFFEHIRTPTHSIQISLNHALMQASYEVDISQRVRSSLSADSVLSVVSVAPKGPLKTVSLELKALLLLRYIDGNLSLGEIAERFGVSFAEILQPADELLQNDMVYVTFKGKFVKAAFVQELTLLACDLVSPVADVIMDDLLTNLGITANTVTKEKALVMLEVLKRYCKDAYFEEFNHQAQLLYGQYGIEINTSTVATREKF